MRTTLAIFITSFFIWSAPFTWKLVLAEGIIFSGNIRPMRQIIIVSKVSTPGRLVSYDVDVGDSVKKGQIIAQVETEDLVTQVQQAEADVQSTKANLDNAQVLAEFNMQAQYAQAVANVKRLEVSLLKAEIEVEVHEVQAKTTVKISKAHLRLAEARLEVAKAKYRPEEIQRGQCMYCRDSIPKPTKIKFNYRIRLINIRLKLIRKFRLIKLFRFNIIFKFRKTHSSC